MGSPAGGSNFVQVAPIARQRIRAAGPGRLRARLRKRRPASTWGGRIMVQGVKSGWRKASRGRPREHPDTRAVPPRYAFGRPRHRGGGHPQGTETSMLLMRKQFIHALAGIAVLALAGLVHAQTAWPSKA